MKSSHISFRPSRRSALTGAFLLAFAGLCPAQTAQILMYDGGHDDRGRAVATDANGSLFVGGDSNATANPVTFAVLKYNAAGTLQWLARAQGLGDYNARTAHDVATDDAGNVYAVGYASKPLPFFQNELGLLVASFDSNGVQRWAQLMNGPGNSSDAAYKVAVDPLQGVYVTGVTNGAFGRPDWITIKYSFAGVELWRRIETGVGNTDDQPVTLKVDGAGNVVVLGYVQPVDVSGPRDLRVVKFDPSGNVLWRADYSDTSTSDEVPSALAIDASNSIYVTADRGVAISPELGITPITIKFAPNGNRLFVLAGPGQGGSAIAIDPAGNFIVSGLYFEENGTNQLSMTSKFTPNGGLVWSLPFEGRNLAVDGLDGSTYLTRGSPFTAVKISAGGQVLWERIVPESNVANDATVDEATGAFIVTGDSTLGNGNIITARFSAGGPPPPPPQPPAAPSALTSNPKKGAIDLAWTDNSGNESGFLIERSVNGSGFVQIAQVGANVRTFSNTGLNRRTSYAYRVRAFNGNGNSGYSNTTTGKPR